jgi:hypothetical protein
MDRPIFGFAGFATVTPPSDGFWRVSSWRDPFDPPPPAPPLGTDPQDDDGHRYDDPEGQWKTLYCATTPEGALGECLGDFKFHAPAVVRIEAFLEGEPDHAFDEEYFRPLTADDVESFRWRLAHAPSASSSVLIDVEHWRTHAAIARDGLAALLRYGVRRLDRSTLLDPRRYITRTLAGVYRREATDLATGELRAAGLRFTSRLPPAWECWALWEPLPLDPYDAVVEDVTIETPQLRTAASMLGIPLP